MGLDDSTLDAVNRLHTKLEDIKDDIKDDISDLRVDVARLEGTIPKLPKRPCHEFREFKKEFERKENRLWSIAKQVGPTFAAGAAWVWFKMTQEG